MEKLKFPAFSWTLSVCGKIYIINKNSLLRKIFEFCNSLILLEIFKANFCQIQIFYNISIGYY